MERHFDQQIEKLKKRLTRMSSLVIEQVENVIAAIENHDKDLALQILEKENIVDKLDLKIEKLCLKLVVLNQPVAMDLRFVFSAITINTSLERIGDHAANIAKGISETNYTVEELELVDFNKTAGLANEMIGKSIESFNKKDAALAKEVLGLEENMNVLCKKNADILKKYLKKNPDRIDEALFIYDMIHGFERIGDLSTNIVEDVYFIIEAQNIRHKYEQIFFDDDTESEQ